MKVESIAASEPQTESIVWPEPQTEWQAELLSLMKAVDESGAPKLTAEEIADYLERPYTKESLMNLQTGTIKITGLSAEVLLAIDQRATAAGHTTEECLRTMIEQQYTELKFTPEETEALREKLQTARAQIDQGNYQAYPSVNAMMDDIEAKIEQRARQRKNGGSQ